MYKYWWILFLFMFVLSIPVTVMASGIEIKVNGQTVEFASPPRKESGRILVPAREFFTALGAAVSWDKETRTVSALADKVRVAIPVGSCLPTVDDVPVPIDVPAMIIGGYVYIPLRFAAESLGGKIHLEAGSSKVSITTAGRALAARGTEGRSDNIYGGKIDINAASVNELVRIEGVSTALAEEIVAYRENNGFYRSFAEIKNLPSVNGSVLENLMANVIILYKEKGEGCYYADRFHGNRTASGEVYDKHSYTAAHRTLPFGTIVKVSFPKTGRSVWVRINDRGPHVAGRIIDLSRAAADALGLTPYGIGWMELEVIIEG